MAEIIALFGTTQMKVIIILIAIDVVLGIIAALRRKEFVFRKVGDFMKGPVLGYVLGLAVIEIVGQALPQISFIVPAISVGVGIALLGSICGNLGKLGLPVPKVCK